MCYVYVMCVVMVSFVQISPQSCLKSGLSLEFAVGCYSGIEFFRKGKHTGYIYVEQTRADDNSEKIIAI